MSADCYTSVHGRLFRISTFAGAERDGRKCTSLTGPWRKEKTSMTGPNTREGPNGPSITTQMLLAECFQFSKESGKFEPHGDVVKLPLDGSDIHLVALLTVFEDLSGVKVPCVVVEQRDVGQQDSQCIFSGDADDLSSSEMYRMSVILLSPTKRKFHVHGSFQLAYSLLSVTDVFILNGPRICWQREGCVYITQASDRSSRRTEVGVVKLDACLWKPSNTLKWVGEINGDAVAMGTEQLSGQRQATSGDIFFEEDQRWAMVKLPATRGGVSNPPMGDQEAFMPHEYSCIVNCIHAHHGRISQSGNGRLNSRDRGLVFLAATNQSQLIESAGGVVRRVYQLPFSDACRIAVAMVTGGEELIIVRSPRGTVCAVWEKTFEVAAEWTDVHSFLIHDFVLSGSDQILLLGDGKDAHQNQFTLTDLGTCNWTTTEMDDVPRSSVSSACAENLLSAVRALEVQMQTAMEAQRMSESRCNLKSRLIEQSQDALCSMARHLPSPESPSASLVCACSNQSQEDSFVETGSPESSLVDRDATLRCLGCWQRVALERWVIGLEVDNQTDRYISDVYISLVPVNTTESRLHSSTSSCFYKSVVSPAAFKFITSTHGLDVQCEPLTKRLKQDYRPALGSLADLLAPGETGTVTGMTAMPEFAFRNFAECNMILHWKEWLPKKSDSETGETSGRVLDGCDSVERRCTCGRAILLASDVVTGKLGINLLEPTQSESESQHDMQCLDAIQQATPLRLMSKHSRLKCVMGHLKEAMGFRQAVRQDVLVCTSGPLTLTRVKIASGDGPSRMAMTVYSRNQSDFLLFCHRLYQLLPDDVIIKPLPPTNQIRSATATALTTIDRELQLASSHLHKLLSLSMVRGQDDQGTAADGNIAGPLNVDRLATARGDFERERSKWHDSGKNVEVSTSNEAQAWRNELLDAKINTDTDVNTLGRLLTLAN